MREFWIDEELVQRSGHKQYIHTVWTCRPHFSDTYGRDAIHVVEKSALEELQEKYNALETKFKIYEGLAVKPNRMILEFDKE